MCTDKDNPPLAAASVGITAAGAAACVHTVTRVKQEKSTARPHKSAAQALVNIVTRGTEEKSTAQPHRREAQAVNSQDHRAWR